MAAVALAPQVLVAPAFPQQAATAAAAGLATTEAAAAALLEALVLGRMAALAANIAERRFPGLVSLDAVVAVLALAVAIPLLPPQALAGSGAAAVAGQGRALEGLRFPLAGLAHPVPSSSRTSLL